MVLQHYNRTVDTRTYSVDYRASYGIFRSNTSSKQVAGAGSSKHRENNLFFVAWFLRSLAL